MIPRAICRYGVRSIPGDERVVWDAFNRGEAVEGPAITEFEAAFANYHSSKYAATSSFGRMAFLYILRALDLPKKSEIIFPALTFWVVPEMARREGFRPVFVDVDPRTFNIDPSKIESALSERTRVIVPTHLYGQPCAMDEIMAIAKKQNLIVIEDCAQAVGALYRGRCVGTFGTASFFSFQLLKGINTYGGGMALTNDATIASRIRKQAKAEPAPTVKDLLQRFLLGYVARTSVSPKGFTVSGFPIQAAASLFGQHDLYQHVWEKIRPLDRLPRMYHQKYSNVQALLGLRALSKLDDFNKRCREHAAMYTQGLSDYRYIETPKTFPGTNPVYYQYSIYAADPVATRRRAIRRGIDVETTHVDVCPKLKLFEEFSTACPGAERTEEVLQLPVYSRLRASDIERVMTVVRTASMSQKAVSNGRMNPQITGIKKGIT